MRWILLFTRRNESRSATIQGHSEINPAKSMNLSTANCSYSPNKPARKCLRSNKIKKSHWRFYWNPSTYQPKTLLFTYKPLSNMQTITSPPQSISASSIYNSTGLKTASISAINCWTKWKMPASRRWCRSTSTTTKQLPSTNWAGIRKPYSSFSPAWSTKKKIHSSKT